MLLTLLIYEHMGSVHLVLSAQGQFDAPLSLCRVHGDLLVADLQHVMLGWILLHSCVTSVTEKMGTHGAHYRAADPLRTPATLRPEWYFLPHYGLLRAVPRYPAAGLLAVLLCLLAPLWHALLWTPLATEVLRGHP